MITEVKYKQKCIELRKRVREIEEHNELVELSLSRTKRFIKRLRLERALLLEKLEERAIQKADDSDGSPSPPDSPTLLAGMELPPPRARHSGNGVSSGHSTPLVKSPPPEDPSSPPTTKKSGKRHAHDDDEEHVTPQTRKKQPPRDPNLPKRPQNAYMVFCEQEKERVKKEITETVQAQTGQIPKTFDLTKVMAEKWRDLDEEGRQHYFKIYEDDKERYLREMAALNLTNPSPSEQKEVLRAEKMLKELVRDRNEGKREAVVSGSALAKMIEATSGPEAAAEAIKPTGLVANSADNDQTSKADEYDDEDNEDHDDGDSSVNKNDADVDESISKESEDSEEGTSANDNIPINEESLTNTQKPSSQSVSDGTTNDKAKEDTVSKDPLCSETDTKETDDNGITQLQDDLS
jgi:non-histone protein 10